MMKLGKSIFIANFLSRPNRSIVLARHGRAILRRYFPSPGRLAEFLKPNGNIALDQRLSSTRKTKFDAIAVLTERTWVSMHSRVPNRIVHEALGKGRLPEFKCYSSIIPESKFGHSRIDFRLESENESCLLEVKSCTLVKDGLALFPDAATIRGRRHLLDLTKARRNRYRACVMFVIQRPDAEGFASNRETDPEFAHALEVAGGYGAEILARKCRVRNFHIALDDALPVFV